MPMHDSPSTGGHGWRVLVSGPKCHAKPPWACNCALGFSLGLRVDEAESSARRKAGKEKVEKFVTTGGSGIME